jgi:hypothetical protein
MRGHARKMIFFKLGTAKINIQKSYSQSILIGLLTLLIFSILILCAVPPVSRDALTHHLAIPKLYLKHGEIYETPNMIFSYYPMNLDLLYMIPLYFGNDIIPKYIHFAFGLLTAWLIFNYLKTRLNLSFAFLGVLFFLSLPLIVKLSITAYVDLGLVFFSTASLINFFKWIEKDFKLKYLVISGICCGLAMGTKYNGLIVLFLLTLFVPYIYSKQKAFARHHDDADYHAFSFHHSFNAAGYALVFMAAALVIFSPWLIRNYIWTHNPIYPLYGGSPALGGVKPIFPGDDDLPRQPDAFVTKTDGIANPFLTRKIIFKETGWQILTIPIRIFFQGKDDDPKYFDGRLNPYLILLPFFAFLPRHGKDNRLRSEKKILVAFSALYLLIAFFQRDLRIRYIGPILPPLVMLSVFGFRNITARAGFGNLFVAEKFVKGVVVIAVIVLLGMNADYIRQQFGSVQPLSFINGRIGRDAYIERFRPEYAAIKFANQNLAEDAKILCLFLGNRGYYSDREMLFGDKFFREIVKTTDSAEETVRYLKDRKITHLLIGQNLFKQWSRQFNHGEKVILADFFKNRAKLIFAKGGYGLYQI